MDGRKEFLMNETTKTWHILICEKRELFLSSLKYHHHHRRNPWKYFHSLARQLLNRNNGTEKLSAERHTHKCLHKNPQISTLTLLRRHRMSSIPHHSNDNWSNFSLSVCLADMIATILCVWMRKLWFIN